MRKPAAVAECGVVCQIRSTAEADRLGGSCDGRISIGCAHRNSRPDGDQWAVLGKFTIGLSRGSSVCLVYLRGFGSRDPSLPATLSCSDKVPLYDPRNTTHSDPPAMPRPTQKPRSGFRPRRDLRICPAVF